MNEKCIEEHFGIKIKNEELKNLKKLREKLVEKVGKPLSYYAVLYLDGDNMGRWLAGELLPGINHAYTSHVWKDLEENDFVKKLIPCLPLNFDKQCRKLLTPAIHASISMALRNYALEFVRKIVEEENFGKLVYAGGDDVLAFVNLKDLLEVMHKLRWAFSGHVKFVENCITVDLKNTTGFVEKDGRYFLIMGEKATASMGVVIAHYKTPLQLVIKKVFEMKEKAKNISKEKNAFAICLMKRRGEERVAKAKWRYEDPSQESNIFDTISTLRYLAKAFDPKNSEGFIAKSFIQKVATEFSRLKNEEGIFTGTADIFDKELRRLLLRSYNYPKDKKISDKEKRKFVNDLVDTMSKLFWNISINIDNFVNFCIIAAFIQEVED